MRPSYLSPFARIAIRKPIKLSYLPPCARSGNGYTNEYPVNRYLRDALLYKVGAGTMEIRRMLIGREFSEFSLLACRKGQSTN